MVAATPRTNGRYLPLPIERKPGCRPEVKKWQPQCPRNMGRWKASGGQLYTKGLVIWIAGLSYPDVNSLRLPELLTSPSFNPIAYQQPSLARIIIHVVLHNPQ